MVCAALLRALEKETDAFRLGSLAAVLADAADHLDRAAANLGLVRRIALSLLKRTPTKQKVGIACKRKQAGWDNDFLVEVLLGQTG
jgi:hypothetical protein